MFANREEAGRELAPRLQGFSEDDPVVLALPRGGVAVACPIAVALEAPLDLLLVRKIGAPGQPELALAAVVDGPAPDFVVNEELARVLDLPRNYLAEEKARALHEIERRRHAYLGNRPPVPLRERTAILVDDGLATGTTARAALRAIRRQRPAQLVLAVPVGTPDTLAALSGDADDIVCLVMPEQLDAIGAVYIDFHQMSDDEVITLLAHVGRDRAFPPAGPAGSARSRTPRRKT